MNKPPNPSRPRYQKLRELGCNRSGGRVTYLVMDHATQQQVVIKQFQFAQSDSNWSGFKAYEREIEVLRSLNHPGIPRYLDSFETAQGFCMVQEYKNAKSFASARSFEPEAIKQIAINILEILVYLQNLVPAVIHRDLKPENILVDEEMNVYLVDFGLARIGGGEASLSSIASGTFGFMPPEQLYNRQLTNATDLYGLGATLICLLTQTASNKIETLIDETGKISFHNLIPSHLSLRWVKWLETMIQPSFADRYLNAAAALEVIKTIDITRSPAVKIVPLGLELKATYLGEKLTQTFKVINDIPDTLLEGNWEVAPHPNDNRRSASSHTWIYIQPAQFSNNHAECQVTVDTSKLMADKNYERQILLRSNASEDTKTLSLKVKTASLTSQKLPWRSLLVLFGIALVGGLIASLIIGDTGKLAKFAWIGLTIGLTIGSIGGLGGAFGSLPVFINTFWIVFILRFLFFGSDFGYFIGLIVGGTAGYIIRNNFGKSLSQGFFSLLSGVLSSAGMISLLTAGLGITVGILLKIGFYPLVILGLLLMAIPLGIKLYILYAQEAESIANYRKSERFLIKP